MVKVKALRAHSNGFGDKYEKAKGDEYDVADPTALVDAKLVEVTGEDHGKGRRASRSAKRAAGAAEGDAAEHATKGAPEAG